jgi:hypothetical protein
MRSLDSAISATLIECFEEVGTVGFYHRRRQGVTVVGQMGEFTHFFLEKKYQTTISEDAGTC